MRMSDTRATDLELDGTVERESSRYIVRFERVYNLTPRRLWDNITRPDLVAGWLGPVQAFELRPGGAISVLLHPLNGAWLQGVVTALDVPHRIEFTWNVPAHGAMPDFLGGTVRLQVQADPSGARLTFEHALPTADRVFDILSATHLRLEQIPCKPGQIAQVNRDNFTALRSRYQQADRLMAIG